jgi:hypothetical protein
MSSLDNVPGYVILWELISLIAVAPGESGTIPARLGFRSDRAQRDFTCLSELAFPLSPVPPDVFCCLHVELVLELRMSNLSDLMNGGVISASATFTEEELAIINKLTAVEVSALISVWGKVKGTTLINNNSNATSVSSNSRNTIGIVF